MTESAPPTILVVCTANLCRSPVVEQVLPLRFGEVGIPVRAASAGVHGGHGDVHEETVRAARREHIDLDGHRSRRLTHRLLTVDAADLVVTMTRDHLYAVVAIDESAWPRTFTLVDLVRRAEALAAERATVGGFSDWVAALAERRRAADLMFDRRRDDIADPYGRPGRHHRRMVRHVDDLCRRLASAAAAVLST